MKFASPLISYAIISLGCSKNQVDAESMNGAMHAYGFQRADSVENADIVIINTCGFIEDAKKESIDVIFQSINEAGDDVSRHERTTFARRIVVAGCLSQRYGDAIKSDIPEVGFVYGVYDANFVPGLAAAFDIRLQRRGALQRLPLEDQVPFSYIKIGDGCSNNCSYCAIPLIRGKQVSYPLERILDDVRQSVRRGARELILVAQDTAAYQSDGMGLAGLVDRIAEIEGIDWIRVLYMHPDHITDDIIKLYATNDRLVKYIDIPFQQVSEPIVRAMGRRGNFQRYGDLIRRLREEIPRITIRSTFMVGFPGEQDADFDELMRFIAEMELDRVGCFVYSPEEGTSAARMKDTVSRKTKRARYDRLMTAQRKISQKRLANLVGSECTVLVEARAGDDQWIGRTEFDAPEVDGLFHLSASGQLLNRIVRARVLDSSEYDLFGELA